MISEVIEGKSVQLYPAADENGPLIVLHTFGDEGEKVWRLLQEMQSPTFSLLAVSGLDWDRDMAPWDCPPTSREDTPCTGGADRYLQVLLNEILPKAEAHIPGTPSWRGIAGYSLAGLFAVYALYQTDRFSRAGSMSGSLWFPKLTEYVTEQKMRAHPDAVYFSLGDLESKTKNPYFRTTQERTEHICRFFAQEGIETVFVQNPGNHYMDADKRTAAGIDWLLRR